MSDKPYRPKLKVVKNKDGEYQFQAVAKQASGVPYSQTYSRKALPKAIEFYQEQGFRVIEE